MLNVYQIKYAFPVYQKYGFVIVPVENWFKYHKKGKYGKYRTEDVADGYIKIIRVGGKHDGNE